VASVVLDPIPDTWRFSIKDGRLCSKTPGRIGRRQEAAPCFRLNGAIYVATPTWLRRHGRFVVHNKSMALVMPRERSVDVEDKIDLDWARFLCSRILYKEVALKEI